MNDPADRNDRRDANPRRVVWLVLGSSDGSARFVDRERLGLDDGDPIVVGEAAKSPLLRALSDE